MLRRAGDAAARFKDATELEFYHDRARYRTDSRPHPSSKDITKALDMIKEHFPAYQRIGTLYCPAEANAVYLKEALEEACKARGLTLDTVAVNTAYILSHERKQKTALVDLDLYFGTAGLALDIGAPDEPPAEESFESTAAFAWLQDNAHGYGFVMSYPRDNPHGIVHEPWHWRLQSH